MKGTLIGRGGGGETGEMCVDLSEEDKEFPTKLLWGLKLPAHKTEGETSSSPLVWPCKTHQMERSRES